MSENPTTTSEPEAPVPPSYALREHNLAYFSELRVGEELLTTRFASSCSMMGCTARCCRDGVLVDIAHRDRILAEAPLIVQFMEPIQEHDPSQWFDTEVEIDTDFPSGKVVNTMSTYGCVFLDSQKRCVLQLAESVSPGLKPFYCRAYPIAIANARVTIDADWCPEELECCGSVEDGPLTVFDVCGWEIQFLLGEAGARELRQIANDVGHTGQQ